MFNKTYRLRKWVKILITILAITSVLIAVFHIPFIRENHYIRTFLGLDATTKNVKIALETEIPSWIEKDIIHIHTTARTGRQLRDIKSVVIHYVGNPNSSAKNNRDYFDKPSTTVSSHFIVGLDGEIIQCVPLYEWSAASNNRNRDTISIEVCHPDESGKFNVDTYNSLVKLTAWLCDTFSISQDEIIRHHDITGKICPKYYVENEDQWLLFKEKVGENRNR